MPAKKRPRKIFLGRMDYCKNEYQRQKLYKSLCGEVEISYMYENIENVKSLKEIEAMPFEKAQEYIENLREIHTVVKLRKHWKITQNQIYKFFREYKISMGPKIGGRGNSKEEAAARIVQETFSTDQKHIEDVKELQIKTVVAQEILTQQPKKSKFNITLEGVFVGESISNRLSNISLILDEQTTYNVKLSVSEDNSNSLFTINAGGTFIGKEIEQRLSSISKIISKESKYVTQFIVEELEAEVINLALGETAATA